MVVVDVCVVRGVFVVRGVTVLLGCLPVVVVVVGASVGSAGGAQGALAGEGGRGCSVQEQSGEVRDEERLVRAHGTRARADGNGLRGTNSPTCRILSDRPSSDHTTTC